MQLRHASAAWRVPHTLIATTCAPAHSQTAGGAGAAEGDQQTLPFITNNITTKRLGQGQASWRAGARPVHPCAPPRCSMLLERPCPTSGRGATVSLSCVALHVRWIHLVPSTARKNLRWVKWFATCRTARAACPRRTAPQRLPACPRPACPRPRRVHCPLDRMLKGSGPNSHWKARPCAMNARLSCALIRS